jgi:hypothetical protein
MNVYSRVLIRIKLLFNRKANVPYRCIYVFYFLESFFSEISKLCV